MPSESGRYNVREIVHWLLPKNKRGQVRSAYSDNGDEEKKQADIRIRVAEAGLKELDLANRQGYLIPLDLIHECFGKVASALRKYGESIEKRLGREELLMFDATLDAAENALNKMFDDYNLREHADAVGPLEESSVDAG